MISRSCIPSLDLSSPLSFDPDEFIMFMLIMKRGVAEPEAAQLDRHCSQERSTDDFKST